MSESRQGAGPARRLVPFAFDAGQRAHRARFVRRRGVRAVAPQPSSAWACAKTALSAAITGSALRRVWSHSHRATQAFGDEAARGLNTRGSARRKR